MALWDVHKDGAWWNAPPEKSFEAYYMTLRVHYEMPAKEAFEYAQRSREILALGQPGGFMGLLRRSIRGATITA